MPRDSRRRSPESSRRQRKQRRNSRDNPPVTDANASASASASTGLPGPMPGSMPDDDEPTPRAAADTPQSRFESQTRSYPDYQSQYPPSQSFQYQQQQQPYTPQQSQYSQPYPQQYALPSNQQYGAPPLSQSYYQPSPQPSQAHPASSYYNPQPPSLGQSTPRPIPIPGAQSQHYKQPGNNSDSSSATSSSYENISRRSHKYGKYGNAITTFFRAPSEAGSDRSSRRRRTKPKKTRFLAFNNSSSSSVDSDLAYGRGYIPRDKSSTAGSVAPGRSPGPNFQQQQQQYQQPPYQQHQQQPYQQQYQSQQGYDPRRSVAADSGRPTAPNRSKTDEEILEIGRKLSDIARHQNDADLRAIGKTRPSQLVAAASAINSFRRTNTGGSTKSRGIGSSRPHGEEGDSEWESASDGEDDSSSDDGGLVYGATDVPVRKNGGGSNSFAGAAVGGAALVAGAAGLYGLSQRDSHSRTTSGQVDPRLFGPQNSLRGLITPLPDDPRQQDALRHASQPQPQPHVQSPQTRRGEPPLPASPHASSVRADKRPMQHVYPVPTSDPTKFDYDRASSVSTTRQTPSASFRPAPVPIQQPVPVTPVSSRVYEADSVVDNSRPRDAKHARSKSDGRILAGAVAATAAAAAIGAVASSSSRKEDPRDYRRDDRRDDYRDDRRSDRRYEAQPANAHDRDRRDRDVRPQRDQTDRKYEAGPADVYDGDRRDRESRSYRDQAPRVLDERDPAPRSSRHSDIRGPSLSRRHTAPIEALQEYSYKLPQGDEIRVEYDPYETRDRDRRREEPRDRDPRDRQRDRGLEESVKPIVLEDRQKALPSDLPLESKSQDKQRVQPPAAPTSKTVIDPFQFQVDSFQNLPVEAPPARPLTPQVFTVEREPDFSSMPPMPIAPTPRDSRLSRKDSFEIEQRLEEEHRRSSRDRSRTPVPRERVTYEEEEHAARSILDEAKQATAPVSAAAFAAAVAIENERSRERRRSEVDSEGSRSRSAAERDLVQEEADRYYRESVIARKIEDDLRSRSASPSKDHSVVDKYREPEEPNIVTIVTPPNMEEEEEHDPSKTGPYAAPDADVRIDNVIKPHELSRFRLQDGSLGTGEGSSVWKSRDPSCERDRPLLNLVRPTPVTTPTPEKQETPASHAVEVDTTPASPRAVPDVIIGPRGEIIQTPSTPKSVSWGENETKSFEPDSPDPSDGERQAKSRPKISKGTGWGVLAAALAGGAMMGKSDEEDKTSSESKSEKSRSVPDDARWAETRSYADDDDKPPVPGPKPVSPSAAGVSPMPGAFGSDNEFAAVLAAGLQDTGFDPNIVIDDPTYRRRDSPPGSNGEFYHHPTVETVTDLGVYDEVPRDRSAPSDTGYVLGDIVDSPKAEKDIVEEEWATSSKLGKKDRKKKYKNGKRQSIDGDEDALRAWEDKLPEPTPETPAVFADEPPAEKLSKKERKKRDRAAAKDVVIVQESPPSGTPTETPPPESFEVIEASEDYWAGAKKKKDKKPAETGDDVREKRVSVPVDAFDDLQSSRELPESAAAADEWDAPKKSKKKSKRDSVIIDSPPRPASEERQSSRDQPEVITVEESDLSKKSKKKSKRDSAVYDSPSRATSDDWQSSREQSEVVTVDESDLSKKSKKSKRDSAIYDSPSRAASDDWQSSREQPEVVTLEGSELSKKSKKKSKRDSSAYDSPSRPASEDREQAEPAAADDWDVSKKSKKKSKRDSSAYDSPSRPASEVSVSSSKKSRRKSSDYAEPDDYVRDRDGDPPDRNRHSFIDDRDVASVASDPASRHERRERRYNGTRYDDDDNRSVLSFASAPDGRKSKDLKRTKSIDKSVEKRSSTSSFFGLFSRGGGDTKDEEKRRSDKDQSSFLGNAGTLGAGVGLAGAAAALGYAASRSNATGSPTDEEPADVGRDPELSASSRARDVDVVDPEIIERVIKPAIDPQYGDLLPLPPSEPSSPKKDLDDEELLPALPDSRPETPPEERTRMLQHPAHVRRRSAHDTTPMKSPSQTAIPLQLRLGQRSGPASPSFFKSSPIASPELVSAPEHSTPRRPARPTSWDSSREIKPLYLLEQSRHVPDGQQDLELPELPPSEPSSSTQQSPAPYVAEDKDIERILGDRSLTLDTTQPAFATSGGHLGSQESTPKAEKGHFFQDANVDSALVDDAPLPLAIDTKSDVLRDVLSDDQLANLPPLPQSGMASPVVEGDKEPFPVEPMSKNRSSYLMYSTPSSTTKSLSQDFPDQSPDATPSKRPPVDMMRDIQEDSTEQEAPSATPSKSGLWKTVAGAAVGGLAGFWAASDKKEEPAVVEPPVEAEPSVPTEPQEDESNVPASSKKKKGKKGKKGKDAAAEEAPDTPTPALEEPTAAQPEVIGAVDVSAEIAAAIDAPLETSAPVEASLETPMPVDEFSEPKLSKKDKQKKKKSQTIDFDSTAEVPEPSTRSIGPVEEPILSAAAETVEAAPEPLTSPAEPPVDDAAKAIDLADTTPAVVEEVSEPKLSKKDKKKKKKSQNIDFDSTAEVPEESSKSLEDVEQLPESGVPEAVEAAILEAVDAPVDAEPVEATEPVDASAAAFTPVDDSSEPKMSKKDKKKKKKSQAAEPDVAVEETQESAKSLTDSPAEAEQAPETAAVEPALDSSIIAVEPAVDSTTVSAEPTDSVPLPAEVDESSEPKTSKKDKKKKKKSQVIEPDWTVETPQEPADPLADPLAESDLTTKSLGAESPAEPLALTPAPETEDIPEPKLSKKDKKKKKKAQAAELDSTDPQDTPTSVPDTPAESEQLPEPEVVESTKSLGEEPLVEPPTEPLVSPSPADNEDLSSEPKLSKKDKKKKKKSQAAEADSAESQETVKSLPDAPTDAAEAIPEAEATELTDKSLGAEFSTEPLVPAPTPAEIEDLSSETKLSKKDKKKKKKSQVLDLDEPAATPEDGAAFPAETEQPASAEVVDAVEPTSATAQDTAAEPAPADDDFAPLSKKDKKKKKKSQSSDADLSTVEQQDAAKSLEDIPEPIPSVVDTASTEPVPTEPAADDSFEPKLSKKDKKKKKKSQSQSQELESTTETPEQSASPFQDAQQLEVTAVPESFVEASQDLIPEPEPIVEASPAPVTKKSKKDKRKSQSWESDDDVANEPQDVSTAAKDITPAEALIIGASTVPGDATPTEVQPLAESMPATKKDKKKKKKGKKSLAWSDDDTTSEAASAAQSTPASPKIEVTKPDDPIDYPARFPPSQSTSRGLDTALGASVPSIVSEESKYDSESVSNWEDAQDTQPTEWFQDSFEPSRPAEALQVDGSVRDDASDVFFDADSQGGRETPDELARGSVDDYLVDGDFEETPKVSAQVPLDQPTSLDLASAEPMAEEPAEADPRSADTWAAASKESKTAEPTGPGLVSDAPTSTTDTQTASATIAEPSTEPASLDSPAPLDDEQSASSTKSSKKDKKKKGKKGASSAASVTDTPPTTTEAAEAVEATVEPSETAKTITSDESPTSRETAAEEDTDVASADKGKKGKKKKNRKLVTFDFDQDTPSELPQESSQPNDSQLGAEVAEDPKHVTAEAVSEAESRSISGDHEPQPPAELQLEGGEADAATLKDASSTDRPGAAGSLTILQGEPTGADAGPHTDDTPLAQQEGDRDPVPLEDKSPEATRGTDAQSVEQQALTDSLHPHDGDKGEQGADAPQELLPPPGPGHGSADADRGLTSEDHPQTPAEPLIVEDTEPRDTASSTQETNIEDGMAVSASVPARPDDEWQATSVSKKKGKKDKKKKAAATALDDEPVQAPEEPTPAVEDVVVLEEPVPAVVVATEAVADDEWATPANDKKSKKNKKKKGKSAEADEPEQPAEAASTTADVVPAAESSDPIVTTEEPALVTSTEPVVDDEWATPASDKKSKKNKKKKGSAVLDIVTPTEDIKPADTPTVEEPSADNAAPAPESQTPPETEPVALDTPSPAPVEPEEDTSSAQPSSKKAKKDKKKKKGLALEEVEPSTPVEESPSAVETMATPAATEESTPSAPSLDEPKPEQQDRSLPSSDTPPEAPPVPELQSSEHLAVAEEEATQPVGKKGKKNKKKKKGAADITDEPEASPSATESNTEIPTEQPKDLVEDTPPPADDTPLETSGSENKENKELLAASTTEPASTSEPAPENTISSEYPETPAVDDFSFEQTSKKGKKNKKRRQSLAIDSLDNATPEATSEQTLIDPPQESIDQTLQPTEEQPLEAAVAMPAEEDKPTTLPSAEESATDAVPPATIELAEQTPAEPLPEDEFPAVTKKSKKDKKKKKAAAALEDIQDAPSDSPATPVDPEPSTPTPQADPEPIAVEPVVKPVEEEDFGFASKKSKKAKKKEASRGQPSDLTAEASASPTQDVLEPSEQSMVEDKPVESPATSGVDEPFAPSTEEDSAPVSKKDKKKKKKGLLAAALATSMLAGADTGSSTDNDQPRETPSEAVEAASDVSAVPKETEALVADPAPVAEDAAPAPAAETTPAEEEFPLSRKKSKKDKKKEKKEANVQEPEPQPESSAEPVLPPTDATNWADEVEEALEQDPLPAQVLPVAEAPLPETVPEAEPAAADEFPVTSKKSKKDKKKKGKAQEGIDTPSGATTPAIVDEPPVIQDPEPTSATPDVETSTDTPQDTEALVDDGFATTSKKSKKDKKKKKGLGQTDIDPLPVAETPTEAPLVPEADTIAPEVTPEELPTPSAEPSTFEPAASELPIVEETPDLPVSTKKSKKDKKKKGKLQDVVEPSVDDTVSTEPTPAEPVVEVATDKEPEAILPIDEPVQETRSVGLEEQPSAASEWPEETVTSKKSKKDKKKRKSQADGASGTATPAEEATPLIEEPQLAAVEQERKLESAAESQEVPKDDKADATTLSGEAVTAEPEQIEAPVEQAAAEDTTVSKKSKKDKKKKKRASQFEPELEAETTSQSDARADAQELQQSPQVRDSSREAPLESADAGTPAEEATGDTEEWAESGTSKKGKKKKGKNVSLADLEPEAAPAPTPEASLAHDPIDEPQPAAEAEQLPSEEVADIILPAAEPSETTEQPEEPPAASDEWPEVSTKKGKKNKKKGKMALAETETEPAPEPITEDLVAPVDPEPALAAATEDLPTQIEAEAVAAAVTPEAQQVSAEVPEKAPVLPSEDQPSTPADEWSDFGTKKSKKKKKGKAAIVDLDPSPAPAPELEPGAVTAPEAVAAVSEQPPPVEPLEPEATDIITETETVSAPQEEASTPAEEWPEVPTKKGKKSKKNKGIVLDEPMPTPVVETSTPTEPAADNTQDLSRGDLGFAEKDVPVEATPAEEWSGASTKKSKKKKSKGIVVDEPVPVEEVVAPADPVTETARDLPQDDLTAAATVAAVEPASAAVDDDWSGPSTKKGKKNKKGKSVVVEEPLPVEETLPVEGPQPVIEEPLPVVEEPLPTTEEPLAVVEESLPTTEEPLPVVEESLPVVEESLPVVEESLPVVEEPLPIEEAPTQTDIVSDVAQTLPPDTSTAPIEPAAEDWLGGSTKKSKKNKKGKGILLEEPQPTDEAVAQDLPRDDFGTTASIAPVEPAADDDWFGTPTKKGKKNKKKGKTLAWDETEPASQPETPAEETAPTKSADASEAAAVDLPEPTLEETNTSAAAAPVSTTEDLFEFSTKKSKKDKKKKGRQTLDWVDDTEPTTGEPASADRQAVESEAQTVTETVETPLESEMASQNQPAIENPPSSTEEVPSVPQVEERGLDAEPVQPLDLAPTDVVPPFTQLEDTPREQEATQVPENSEPSSEWTDFSTSKKSKKDKKKRGSLLQTEPEQAEEVQPAEPPAEIPQDVGEDTRDIATAAEEPSETFVLKKSKKDKKKGKRQSVLSDSEPTTPLEVLAPTAAFDEATPAEPERMDTTANISELPLEQTPAEPAEPVEDEWAAPSKKKKKGKKGKESISVETSAPVSRALSPVREPDHAMPEAQADPSHKEPSLALENAPAQPESVEDEWAAPSNKKKKGKKGKALASMAEPEVPIPEPPVEDEPMPDAVPEEAPAEERPAEASMATSDDIAAAEEPVGESWGYTPSKKSKKDKKRSKISTTASRSISPVQDSLEEVANSPAVEDPITVASPGPQESPAAEDPWDASVSSKKSKKGKKGKLAAAAAALTFGAAAAASSSSKETDKPSKGSYFDEVPSQEAAAADSEAQKDNREIQTPTEEQTQSREIAAAYLESDRSHNPYHSGGTDAPEAETVDSKNPLGIMSDDAQTLQDNSRGGYDDVWGDDTRGNEDMDDIWGQDTRGNNDLDDVWGDTAEEGASRVSNDVNLLWSDTPKPKRSSARDVAASYLDTPRGAKASNAAPKSPPQSTSKEKGSRSPKGADASSPPTSTVGKKKKAKGKKRFEGKTPGGGDDLFDDPVLWEGADKKHISEAASAEVEMLWGSGGEDNGDEQQSPYAAVEAAAAAASVAADAGEESNKPTAVDKLKMEEEETAESPILGHDDNVLSERSASLPKDEGHLPTTETREMEVRESTERTERMEIDQAIDRGFEAEQRRDFAAEERPTTDTFMAAMGSPSDFRRPKSRGLPPVQEEGDEFTVQPTPRSLRTRDATTPDPDRDSGFSGDMPQATHRGATGGRDNNNNRDNRDSGVHLREYESTPRQTIHSPPEPSWPPTTPSRGLGGFDDGGSGSITKPKLRRSPLSRGELRDSPLSKTPKLREPGPRDITPEPQKNRHLTPEPTERRPRYGNLGSSSTRDISPGAAAAAASISGRRSVSDHVARIQSPVLRETTSIRSLRRVASNTSLARQHTPEPLTLAGSSTSRHASGTATAMRPESPASGIFRGASATPPLRRVDKRNSGDLRSLSQRSQVDLQLKQPDSSSPSPSPKNPSPGSSGPSPAAVTTGALALGAGALAAAAVLGGSSSSSSSSASDKLKDKHSSAPKASTSNTPVANEGRVRAKDMPDVYDGVGEGRIGSPRSPTRPHSMRRRQSMQVLDLESRVEQLTAENRMLAEAKAQADAAYNSRSHGALADRDSEIDQLRQSLDFLQKEVARLTEVNDGLNSANAQLASQQNDRFRTLETQHSETSRALEASRASFGTFETDLASKDAEIERLKSELEQAKAQIRTMQQQILDSKAGDANFLRLRDVDHFDHRCQQLCSHAQQWVLRFSKFSDMRACRLTSEINDEKVIDRLDNSVLDGYDVDTYLGDRVKRRDIFMSMTMNMIWEFVFTRYLFGMDREQRQKLKSLEKLLTEVGPARAVRQWRAVTLTLLSKRPTFKEQRDLDTEAVVQAVFHTLSKVLPPPSNLEDQILSQLRRVMREAVDLSIEMRTQRAEYMMLPPLQPTYDEDGELAETVTFNAALMSERSGDKSLPDGQALEAQGAVVRVVLFPLVVKKGDDDGEGDDEIVVCPAQVLVQRSQDKRRSARLLTPSSDAGGASLLGAPTLTNRSDVSMGGMSGMYSPQQMRTPGPESDYRGAGI